MAKEVGVVGTSMQERESRFGFRASDLDAQLGLPPVSTLGVVAVKKSDVSIPDCREVNFGCFGFSIKGGGYFVQRRVGRWKSGCFVRIEEGL